MEYLASLFLHLRLEGKIHSICVFFLFWWCSHTHPKKNVLFTSRSR